MTTGDPQKMREFQMRPHHTARKCTTSAITCLIRDDWGLQEHPCPYNETGWFNYWDEVYLARLNYIGERMGWEAPRFNADGIYDSTNIERKKIWKSTHHVMRVMLLAEIVNQIMASDRFDEQLSKFKDMQAGVGTIPKEFILAPLKSKG